MSTVYRNFFVVRVGARWPFDLDGGDHFRLGCHLQNGMEQTGIDGRNLGNAPTEQGEAYTSRVIACHRATVHIRVRGNYGMRASRRKSSREAITHGVTCGAYDG